MRSMLRLHIGHQVNQKHRHMTIDISLLKSIFVLHINM